MKLNKFLVGVSFVIVTTAAQALDLNPGRANFGEVPIGYRATTTFQVYNDSRHWVQLTSITTDRPDVYAVDTNCPAVLHHKQSCTVAVTYAPNRSAFLDRSEITVNFLDDEGDDHDEVFNAYGRPY